MTVWCAKFVAAAFILAAPQWCFAQQAVVRATPDARAGVEATTTFATSVDVRVRGRLAESAGDLLDEAPGLHVRRSGDGLSPQSLMLRGSPAAHVVVALDGVVLNDAASDGVDVSLIPPALIERVDVYRGVVPVHLGVGGLGGAVEFVTRIPERGVHGFGALGYGAFGARRASASVSVRGDNGSAIAAIGYRGSDGNFPFYDQRGTPALPAVESLRRNAGGDAVDGMVRACTQNGVCLLGVVGWRDRGVPGPGSQPTDGPFASQRRALMRVTAPWRMGTQRATLWGAAIVREDLFANVGAVPLFNSTPYVALSRSGIFEAGVRGDLVAAPWRVVSMLRVRYESFGGGLLRIGDLASQRVAGLAGGDVDVHSASVRATLGAAVEILADQGATSSGTRLPYSIRAGIAWTLRDGVELRANAVHARRAPSLTELYGDQGFSLGNPSLREETATSGDAGFVLTAHTATWRIRGEIVGYARYVDDLIALVQVNRSRFKPSNLGTVAVLGAEALLRIEFNAHLRASLAYAWTNARVLDVAPGVEGNQVPLVPAHDLYALGEVMVAGVVAGANVSYVSSAFLDASNDPAAIVPSRVLVGASVSYNLPFARALTVGVTVTNLFDQRTTPRMALSGGVLNVPIQDFMGYPLPGRAWFVSLSAVFDRN
jgi:vitamin B12 transporter